LQAQETGGTTKEKRLVLNAQAGRDLIGGV